MHPGLDDDWSLSLDEARQLQEALTAQVSLTDDLGDLRTIAGVTLSYPRTATGAVIGRSAVVVLRWPDLELVEQRLEHRPVTFPRVPELLSFREAPVALAGLSLLRSRPDLLMVNGHGRAHPGRLGLASHLGVLLDVPSVGCAGTIAVGKAVEPGAAPGERSAIQDGDEVIGTALRTRSGSRPVYVSSGHRVSLETATAIVLQCSRGFRLPEPTRLAGRLASQRS